MGGYGRVLGLSVNYLGGRGYNDMLLTHII